MKNSFIKYFCLTICVLNFFNALAFNKTKILLEENKGQIINANGEKLNNVFFRANLPGVCIWITERGIVYNFYKNEKSDTLNPLIINANKKDNLIWYRSEMNLKSSKISLNNLIKNKQADFHYNFQKGLGALPIQANLFEEIIFENVYEGIDWKLYVDNNQIKQEFIVKPFANQNLIDLEYRTTGKLDIQNTKISFSNPLGVFTEGDLYCYQNEKSNTIKAKYISSHQIENKKDIKIYTYSVKIKTENYIHNQTLIIDPILDWSTLYGGGNDEDGHSIFNDGTNTWVAGHSLSFNFPTSDPGSPTYFQGSNAGGFGDAFILKFSNNGNLLWATYYGGTSNDEASAIYSNGTNVWVAGYTGSVDFPVLNPGNGAFYSGANSGGIDGFITKFSTNGALIWSTYCGGITNDNISAIHCNNNELFVGGTSDSPNFPLLNSGNYFQSYAAANDGFIMKFNANNNLIWSTFLGGSGNDLINTLQTNGNNLFIGGYTNSTNFITLNASTFFQAANAGSYDGFVSKFTLNGALNWSTYFGGNNSDRINSLTLSNNALWVTGISSSTNMPLFNPGGPSFNQSTNNGFSDGFISKFSFSGALQWSSYYGGSSTDFLTSITSDGKNVFVGGYTNSTNLFTQNPGLGGYYQNTNAGFFDAILLKFDTVSACKWASYFGNSSNDYIDAIACNGSKIFATGYTQSYFFPTLNPGAGAYYQSTNATGLDCFVTTFKNCTNPTLTVTTSPPCIGNPFSLFVNGYAGATYQWLGPQSFFSTQQNPTITNVTASNSGNYSIIVSVPNGCINSDFINVTMNVSPTVTVSSNSTVCSGDTIKLFTNANTSYSWTGAASFSSTNQNPIIVNSSTLNAGNYYVSSTNSVGCYGTASLVVNVYPYPLNVVSGSGTVCVGGAINLTSNSAIQYSWQGPNNYTANIQNPTILNANVINQGYYVITISDANNCKKTDSVFVMVSICTDLNSNYVSNSSLSLYPNPAKNFIFINGINCLEDGMEVSIINSEGKKVVSQKNSKQIDISSLSEGIYVLNIFRNNSIIFSQKIIKINN